MSNETSGYPGPTRIGVEQCDLIESRYGLSPGERIVVDVKNYARLWREEVFGENALFEAGARIPYREVSIEGSPFYVKHLGKVSLAKECNVALLSTVEAEDYTKGIGFYNQVGAIRINFRDGQRQHLLLDRGQMVNLGRGYQGADLGPSVSRDHGAVGLSDDGELMVEDHNSSYGTTVELAWPGLSLSAGRQHALDEYNHKRGHILYRELEDQATLERALKQIKQ